MAADHVHAGIAERFQLQPEQTGRRTGKVFEATGLQIQAIDDPRDALQQRLVERQFFVFVQTIPSRN